MLDYVLSGRSWSVVVLASLFARLPLNINALNYPMEDIVFSVSFIDVSFLV